MSETRAGAAATLLLDGRVLETGGVTGTGVTASAERYSPLSKGFIGTSSMQAARANHTATLLADGRVLVAGGTGADGQALFTTELFDPSANAWRRPALKRPAPRPHRDTAR